MVHYLASEDIVALFDDLCAQASPPSPLWHDLHETLRQHVKDIAEMPDASYLPRHKWLEYLSAILSHAQSIAQESQLRGYEASAMLRQLIGSGAPLHKQLRYDAALEEARYAPMMLLSSEKESPRHELLHKRWRAMLAVQQVHMPLSEDSIALLNSAVEIAISDPAFQHYRTGPMLQFFAEMLLSASECEAECTTAELGKKIGPHSAHWKRFALKSARFSKRTAAQTPPDIRHFKPENLRLH